MSTDSVLVPIVRAELALAEELGIDAQALAAEVGLRAEELQDPDGRVSLAKYIALVHALARRPGVEDAGVRVGKEARLEHMGVVGWAMAEAPTVGEALEHWTRYRHLLGYEVMPDTRLEADRLVFHRAMPGWFGGTRYAAEVALSSTLAIIAELVGQPTKALEVWFQFPPPADVMPHVEVFGVTPRFGQAETLIAISSSILSQPVARADPGLYAYLRRRADELLAKLPVSERHADRVKRLLAEELKQGEPRAPLVARKLGMSERSLQRRLQEEGTSFAELLDSVRKTYAESWLRDASLSIGEVGFLLGYAEPSVFHRAFRRWTGLTPAQFRRAAAGA